MNKNLIALLAALLLAGCGSTPVVEPKPLASLPASFKEAPNSVASTDKAVTLPQPEWWRVFSDSVLNDLEQRARLNNTTVQQAAARLDQARALKRNVDANRALQLGAAAGVSRQGGPLINAAGGDGTLINTSLNLSYEADLFGRLSDLSQASLRDEKASEALLQSAQLVVQAEVAQTYFSLSGIDSELAVVRSSLQAHKELLQLTERSFRSGLTTEVNVERVQVALELADSDRLTLLRQRSQLESALAVLIGEAASSFSLAELELNATLPVIPAGIPSQLLTRRPDVIAAQQSMLASHSRLGAAKAAWFPSLSLTASTGYASPDLATLFTTSTYQWAIGGLMALPIFDGGRRDAAVKGASAETDLALATYREHILIAFKDVEDQLSSLRILKEQAEVQKRAQNAALRMVKLSDSRFRSGLSSRLDLLDARQSELQTQRRTQQVRTAQYQVTVGLVKALGGSW